MRSAQIAYNTLRWIGQTSLLGPDAPPRHPAKRQRLKLAFGYACPILAVFSRFYGQLATP